MEYRLKLIKKYLKKTLEKDFDFLYDSVREMAENGGYYGEIKVIDDKKYVSFYTIEEVDQ